MADRKVSSEGLIRIRKGLGGGPKATTQTARIARKVAEKTAKRNKITLSVKHNAEGLTRKQRALLGQSLHTGTIKRGGVPVAMALFNYNKGDPWTDKGRQPYPPKIEVEGIAPVKNNKMDIDSTIRHADYANKTLKRSEVKKSLLELHKKFPKTKMVEGHRVTGLRDNLKGIVSKPVVGNINDEGFAESLRKERAQDTQRMKLPKLPPTKTRLEKALVHNNTRLRGAMKGVEMLPPKLAKSLAKASPVKALTAPLEAGITAYATGGGLTGAAASAATTTVVGAGITTALRRAATVVTKAAPVLGRVGARAVPALAVAGAAYDVGRTLNEGFKAYKAHADAKANELAMTNKYGTIEAATKTRRRKKNERA